MQHHPDCDVNDANIEGIRKPCNCGATSSVEGTHEKQPRPGALGVIGGSLPVQSAEGLLKKYETELSRLIASRDGLTRAIFRTQAKVEAARELIGLPVLAKKRGRPRRQEDFPNVRQPEENTKGSRDDSGK